MVNHYFKFIQFNNFLCTYIKNGNLSVIHKFCAFLLSSIDQKLVTPNESPRQLQNILGNLSLPENGKAEAELISKTTDLLFNHSLLNGHPKFLGYITSSAAPIGALADLLAASVNPNVGAHILSPITTEN